MSKERDDKFKALKTTLDKLDKTYGKGTVMKLGDKQVVQVDVISTGSLGIDVALGVGGFPKGRVIEIYGPESSGKTTLTLHIAAECQNGSPASDPVMTLIRVIDTGPGIPPETKAKLFTPYFTTRSGGSGLGLATTKRVIEAMGGRISVESDVGKGAAFTIHLPQSGPGERT